MKHEITPEEREELAKFLGVLGINIALEPENGIWFRWWAWRCLHLEVEKKISILAFDMYGAGYRHWGIGAAFEVLRWKIALEKTEMFKCCNDYRSRYARFLEWQHPVLTGFFRKRKLKDESWKARVAGGSSDAAYYDEKAHFDEDGEDGDEE